MKGHDSKQVRELFLALVDLSSNQQEPWLREQVKGDQELYDEVYSLLRFDDPSHDALECHLTELVYDTADQTPTDKQSNGVVDPVFGPLPEDRTAEPLSNPKELIGAIDSASTIESDHQSANVSLSERQRLSDIISHFHLPNYQLLQPIGMGAFGSVWKARDRRLQRHARREQREAAAAHGRHRRRAARLGDERLDARHVWEVALVGHGQLERALRQVAVADLAATRRAP